MISTCIQCREDLRSLKISKKKEKIIQDYYNKMQTRKIKFHLYPKPRPAIILELETDIESRILSDLSKEEFFNHVSLEYSLNDDKWVGYSAVKDVKTGDRLRVDVSDELVIISSYDRSIPSYETFRDYILYLEKVLEVDLTSESRIRRYINPIFFDKIREFLHAVIY